MEKQVLNYRIIIEPEKMDKKVVYNAYCPTLGLADWGNSVDEAIKNIKSLIKFHIKSMLEDKQTVPKENIDGEIIASTKVSISGSGTDARVLVA